MKTSTNFVKAVIISFLIMGAILTNAVYFGFGAPGLELTTATDKSEYYLREKVAVSGSVTFDGTPVANALVALEVHSQNDVTMAYRTVKVGSPNETWVLDVIDISVWDLGSPPNRLNTVKVGNTVKISVTVYN